MNEVKCNARIKFELSKIFKVILTVYYIIVVITFYKTGPAKNDDKYFSGNSEGYNVTHYEHQYIWGKMYHYEVVSEYFQKVRRGEYVFNDDDKVIDEKYYTKVLVSGVIYTLLLIFIPIVILWYIKKTVSASSLILYEDKLSGRKKTLSEDKLIDIPVKKIKDIRIKNGLLNKVGNGYTLMIRTDIEEISLNFVQNASIFAQEVNSILEKNENA